MAAQKGLVKKKEVKNSSQESPFQPQNDLAVQLMDNRPEAIQLQQIQESADNGILNDEIAQLQATADASSTSTAPFQFKENNTGLPDNLKSGMENLSGMSLDHVKVHRNSDKPAAVQAHAYAQGSDIHLASGQEKHLPHELGHVVQQAEGRVRPTTSVNGMAVNDSTTLEKEADSMGARALQRVSKNNSSALEIKNKGNKPIQMVKGISDEQLKEAKHFAKHQDGTIELPKDISGVPIPSNQTIAYNKIDSGDSNTPLSEEQVAEINALVTSVGAKSDNRKERAAKAQETQKKRSKPWNKIKKGLYKGGAKTLGGLGGAAAGAAAGAPLGPGAIGTAMAGGAIGGAMAGGAAGMTWNTGEKGTDLVAAGRERELASSAGFMGRNGKSSQKDALHETGKDVLLGAVSGGLAPLIGVGGDAIGALAGEGGGGIAAEAFSSGAMGAVSKEAADYGYDEATGANKTSLTQRGLNMLTGTLIGAATGALDELDASAVASNDAGIELANDGTVDLHQWAGQGGEATSDMGYGLVQEGLGGAVEMGSQNSDPSASSPAASPLSTFLPTSRSLHDVVNKNKLKNKLPENMEIAKNKFLGLKGEGEAEGEVEDVEADLDLEGEWEPDKENPEYERWSKPIDGCTWFYDKSTKKSWKYDPSTGKHTQED